MAPPGGVGMSAISAGKRGAPGMNIPGRKDPESLLPKCSGNKAVGSDAEKGRAGLARAGAACVRGQERRGGGRQALKTPAWQN